MLFDNAIEIFIHWKGVYSPRAAKNYVVRLRKFLLSLPTGVSLQDISGDDIVRFHKQMEADHYSRATISYSLMVLKNFLFFWKNRGEKVPNPEEIKPILYTNRLKPVVSSDDFKKMSAILNEFAFRELQMKLAIHLLWDTGMRVSELLDLKLSDLRDPNSEGVRTAQLLSKKSSRYNLVAWGKDTDRLLCMYLGVRLSYSVTSDSLFINLQQHERHNRKIVPRTVQRWIYLTAIKAGITKRISPHSFRHGKAHYMLDNGANIRDVQAVLRHINPITTFHYLALNDRQFIDVAGKYLTSPI